MKPIFQDPLVQHKWDETLKVLGRYTRHRIAEIYGFKYEEEKEGGRPETKPPSSW